MKVSHYKDIPGTELNNDMVKLVTGRVLVGKNDGAPNFCMRRFDVEPGGHAPRHTHDWEHEIFVHSGIGKVYQNGEWREVKKVVASDGAAGDVGGCVSHRLIAKGIL